MNKLSEYWVYPEAPVDNVFGSHPGYDEALGPFKPNSDGFIPIDQVSIDESLSFDGSDESDETNEEPAPIVVESYPCAETARGWWTAPTVPPILEKKLCLKDFDRRFHRWRRVVRHLPITL